MVDLTSPNPLVMTHFELIAAVSAVSAVILAIIMDLWRARRRKH
ncbi:MAG TPA: hypothetical protein VMG11_03100 [Steroidobacteraceae bacterium]|nr:hypothetical protein [Steroidobacteraceae bacterium]